MFNVKFLVVVAFLMMPFSQVLAKEVRIRGELKKFEGQMAHVETSAGQIVTVNLSKEFKVLVYQDIKLEDLELNAYLSIPSINIGGKRRALGIHVFPEAFRGFNEGLSDWDLTPGSKMTNATLAKLKNKDNKSGIEVTFGKEKHFYSVDKNTPITTFDIDKDAKIELGQKIVIFAREENDRFSGEFVGIHQTGKLPPI